MVRAPEQQLDWPAILAQHDRWLRTVVYARLRDASAVEEVLQEVALAAVKQAAPLKDASKAAPWLYRLAVTQSLLYRRKLGRQRRLRERFIEAARPDEFDHRERDPLDWLLAEERGRMVRRAVQSLPRRDAEILLLKYTENWSYQQIAERLGVTQAAIEARLHRARQRLREALETLNVVPAK